MKKFYFLFIFIFFANCVLAQNVYIPDANLKEHLLNSDDFGIAQDEAGEIIQIDTNYDGEIQFSEALEVYSLVLDFGGMATLTGIEAFTNLKYLDCSDGNLTELDVTALVNLEVLGYNNNSISSIQGLNSLTQLQSLGCSNNQISELDLSGLFNLTNLGCAQNQLTTLDLTSFPLLYEITCDQNDLTSLTVAGLSNLQYLRCIQNNLTTLDLSGLSSLVEVFADANQIQHFSAAFIGGHKNIYLAGNPIITIDTSMSTNVSTNIFCQDCSLLENLFLKNDVSEWLYLTDENSINYICSEESRIPSLITILQNVGVVNPNVTSYCSFNPGGEYFALQGNITYTSSGGACVPFVSEMPNVMLTVSNTIGNTSYYSESTATTYNIFVPDGIHTITPQIENNYFSFSPPSITYSFPEAGSLAVQDFCLTPNGIHHDLEISVIPLQVARPGFDCYYKVVYRNKGTEIQPATISVNYDDATLDFINSDIPPTQTSGNLSWILPELAPFQAGEFVFVMNVNSPMEIPAVNAGDVLEFSSTITSNDDQTPLDNTSVLSQIVVNSFDPNDKTCLEGTVISPAMVGQYVHYVIRFENTGTFPAQNIVVKDLIDLSKFDISSLVPLSGSHEFETRVKVNKVEFIFENIMLPFDDATNDGYVAFKIKTLPTLVLGDSFENSASIYFDYNFPIITDPAVTTIQSLRIPDFEFSKYFTLYPNPASNVLNLKANSDIAVKSLEIYNVLGMLVLKIPNASTISAIDISQLKSGTYFLKINSETGSTNAKFVRN